MTVKEYGIKKAAETILEKGCAEGDGVNATDDEVVEIVVFALQILNDRIKMIEKSLSQEEK